MSQHDTYIYIYLYIYMLVASHEPSWSRGLGGGNQSTFWANNTLALDEFCAKYPSLDAVFGPSTQEVSS